MAKSKTTPSARTKKPLALENNPDLLDRPLRDFVGTPEAAALLNVRYASVVRAIHNGDLVAFRVTDRCWLVLRESIDQHLATRSAGGRPREK